MGTDRALGAATAGGPAGTCVLTTSVKKEAEGVRGKCRQQCP